MGIVVGEDRHLLFEVVGVEVLDRLADGAVEGPSPLG
jgi:hypothetical protein